VAAFLAWRESRRLRMITPVRCPSMPTDMQFAEVEAWAREANVCSE
jgi:hypothetical protein